MSQKSNKPSESFSEGKIEINFLLFGKLSQIRDKNKEQKRIGKEYGDPKRTVQEVNNGEGNLIYIEQD